MPNLLKLLWKSFWRSIPIWVSQFIAHCRMKSVKRLANVNILSIFFILVTHCCLQIFTNIIQRIFVCSTNYTFNTSFLWFSPQNTTMIFNKTFILRLQATSETHLWTSLRYCTNAKYVLHFFKMQNHLLILLKEPQILNWLQLKLIHAQYGWKATFLKGQQKGERLEFKFFHLLSLWFLNASQLSILLNKNLKIPVSDPMLGKESIFISKWDFLSQALFFSLMECTVQITVCMSHRKMEK